MRTRSIVLAIVLALAGADANAQTSVTFGFTAGGDALPVFVAKEEGLFEKAGLRVELQRLANTALGVPAIASQSIQLSQLTAPVFLQAREAGLDLVATSGLTLYGDDITAGAVTLPDSPIKRAADFSGKTVAVAGLRGTTQVLFTKWLMQQNVDPKSVKFVEATFSVMLDLLKSRKVDAALLGGPIFSRAVNSGTVRLAGPFFQETAQGQILNLVAATKQWADANKTALAAFRTSMEAGAQIAQRDPAKARSYLAKYLALTPDVAKEVDLPKAHFELSEAKLKWWIDILREQELLRGALDPAGMIAAD
jgi:NitT/TauT family transport system substrate-binding protein